MLFMKLFVIIFEFFWFTLIVFELYLTIFFYIFDLTTMTPGGIMLLHLFYL